MIRGDNVKKVAAINDLSGFGRCSLTVALPIISSFGLQCIPLPTAILSNHTAYDSYFFDDYTDKMPAYYAQWEKLGLEFDCIYTGFLGSEKQIDITFDFIEKFGKNTLLLVDPVMGDDGKIYTTYTKEMCEKIKKLAAAADIITPNITEACLLSDTEYKEDFTAEEIGAIAEKIHRSGTGTVIITGLHKDNAVGNYIYDGASTIVTGESLPCRYCGTGDLFASLLCGHVLCGKNIKEAVEKSADFVHDALLRTYSAGTDSKDGIEFERLIAEKMW